jgi:hypothetical protein
MLWGKEFYTELLNEAMLQFGSEPSNEIIFALAIQKLLNIKKV